MRVLGIETSCDETGVAIYDDGRGSGAGLLAHRLYSQIDMHADYGGVVPELASRDHIRKLVPLVREVMAEARCEPAAKPERKRSGGRGQRCLLRVARKEVHRRLHATGVDQQVDVLRVIAEAGEDQPLRLQHRIADFHHRLGIALQALSFGQNPRRLWKNRRQFR